MNTGYAGQSRTSYLLAFQMIWLTKSTTKFLDADLKFNEKKSEKKDKKKGDKKDGKKGGPKKDGPAPADNNKPAPADNKPADNQPAQPEKPADNQPKKENYGEPVDQLPLEKLDRNNGRLVERDGTTKEIRDGKVIQVNGKRVRPRDATRAEKDLLLEEEKKRNKQIEEKNACTGWYCL